MGISKYLEDVAYEMLCWIAPGGGQHNRMRLIRKERPKRFWTAELFLCLFGLGCMIVSLTSTAGFALIFAGAMVFILSGTTTFFIAIGIMLFSIITGIVSSLSVAGALLTIFSPLIFYSMIKDEGKKVN